jgi:hypothetical protein
MHIAITSSIPFLSSHLFTLMLEDTRDSHKSLCNEIVLVILQLANKDMLNESGNPIYLRMKTELDELW